jgi:hypothetical protein
MLAINFDIIKCLLYVNSNLKKKQKTKKWFFALLYRLSNQSKQYLITNVYCNIDTPLLNIIGLERGGSSGETD